MKKYFDKTNLIFAIICGVLLLTMIVLLIFPIHYENMVCYDYEMGMIVRVQFPINGNVQMSPFKIYGILLNIPQTAVFCSIALVFLVFAVLLIVRLARKGMFADMKAKIQANRKPTKAEQIADLQKQIDELKQQNNDQDELSN